MSPDSIHLEYYPECGTVFIAGIMLSDGSREPTHYCIKAVKNVKLQVVSGNWT